MSNFLVETKNEYTTHLINILTPLIFEGLQSIYKESLELAGPNDILKLFQSCLKRIPKWNQSIIEKETSRIINSSHSYGWLNDLIKATLKANLVVLMYNPTCKTQVKITPSFYQDIKTSDFIHKVYIECARELWNNPYLLYHDYSPIEIKRNQRDCLNIIKDCIKEALRKLLPVKHILQIYLGEEMELNAINDQFEKVMSDVEERNLTKLIKKDLSNERNLSPIYENQQNKLEYKQLDKLEHRSTDTPREPLKSNNDLESFKMLNQKEQSNSDEKTIGSRILNIINNNSITTSDIASILSSDEKVRTKLDDNSTSSSELDKSIKKFEQTLNPSSKPILKGAEHLDSLDDKVKKILQKDLATDSDLETSLNYSQEENENKYQEIFSNSNNVIKKGKETVKETVKDNKNVKDKSKFFNNYLQF